MPRAAAGANPIRLTACTARPKPRCVPRPAPFAPHEWLIAWRYLRARRAEGGISAMTWISVLGITLAVFALIATLAVRAGFRAEFVDTILGSNAHVTVYAPVRTDARGAQQTGLVDYEAMAARVAEVPGVTRVAPLVRGQVMANAGGRNAGAEVFGIRPADLATLPRIADPETARGDIGRFGEGVAIGVGVARELNVGIGDSVRLISPDGARTAFGTSPRISAYEVVYIFEAGRYDIDRTRVYMPFPEAQVYFNRQGVADELEVMVEDPEEVDAMIPAMLAAGGADALVWTWKDASGAFLRALDIEDNVMFVIMSILVLIAAMNIVSGLVMLVKNKGRDIGILRTIGLTEGAVMRVFFLCGALTGLVGTVAGVILGCAFAYWIDPIFGVVDRLSGGGVWDPSMRGIYHLPALLRLHDVISAVALSLGLSFLRDAVPGAAGGADEPGRGAEV